MQKLKYNNEPIVILFGGAGREDVVLKLILNKYHVKEVLLPYILSPSLKESLIKFKKIKINTKCIQKKQLTSYLEKHKKCVLISIGYPYVIPEKVLSYFNLALNLHPTLLPKYRGPTSGAYILMNNEKKTGSTIHLMTKNIDDGDILENSSVELNAFDTVISMKNKVYRLEPKLVLSVLHKLKKGLLPYKQNKRYASTFKKVRKPEDSKINFRKPLINLINDIRACDAEKYPAFFIYKGQKVCVKLWRPNKSNKLSDEL